MTLFLKDLVHDLREKRLWPVAALLALAIAAVPAILMRSPGEEPPPPPAAGAPAGADPAAAAVALAGEEEIPASGLESFEAKDPFQPRGAAAPTPPAQQGSPSPAPSGGDAGSASASGAGSASGGSGGGPPPLDPSPEDSPAPASGGSPGTPVAPPAQSGPVLYTYEVDVRFGRRGSERTRRGVDRMQPLPNADRPLLVFLGTSASGRSAVFLVDASLEQRGEGLCEPNRRNCSLLYLRDDGGHDLHYFTDTEGRGYALRLLDIRLVPVADAIEEQERRAADARRSRSEGDDHRTRWPFDVTPFADAAR